MAEAEYRRLTRSKSRSIFGIVSTSRSSLWLGPDHLLCIDTTGYSEVYKRFYFRDIQGVVVRQTVLWHAWTAAWVLLGGLMGAIALAVGAPIATGIFAGLAGLILLVLILHLAAGPSCACQLRTAVQTEDLVSINRVRQARKVLARLRPILAAAQGQLDPGEIPAQFREWQGVGGAVSAAAAGEPADALPSEGGEHEGSPTAGP